jgi:predicted amidohydrolase YtcJ
MLTRVLLAFVAVAGTSVLLTSAALTPQTPGAPAIAIVNARIFTGVAASPWAEALTIVGQRIGVVGTTADVRRLAGPSTRIVDAGGRVVIPGINDAHVHVGARTPGVELDGPPAFEHDPSLDEVLARIKAAVAKTPKGGWVYGEFGGLVLDDAKATRFALDAVAPDHFVVLGAWTGHGTLLNTAALRQLRIADDEPDPPGGFFVRTPGSRTITGMAHEYADYIVARRLAMMPDEKAQAAALVDYAREAASFGITSAQVMATNRPAIDLARSAVSAGLPIRLRIIDFPLAPIASWRQPASKNAPASGRVTVSGTKWILDGTPVERLMFLREPYADKRQTRGQLNFRAADLAGFLSRALAQREQPMFHAVGDAAIDAVLTGLEQSGGAAWQPIRPRIEHGDMTEPAHFPRIKQTGAIVVQNPSHFMLPAVMAARLGARTSRVTMMRTLLASGVPVALGSDGPANPYLNVMFATINANNPAEAMTREQAVAAYTSGAAAAEREETRKGTLSPGMLADLAMLSQDIFTAAPDALPKTVSVLTIVGGSIVHERR